MRHNTTAEVSSLERGRQVLEWLSQMPGGEARVREMTEALGIPRASLYRIIKSLLSAGWIEETVKGGKYRMGQGLAALGLAARANCPLVHAARPVLQEIAQETHNMSELVVTVSPTKMLVLDCWCTEQTALSVAEHYGETFPLNHIMTHGRCFVYFDGKNRLERYLRFISNPENMRACGVEKAPRQDAMREDAERKRKLGYLCGWRTHHPELARVAVPVFDPRSSQTRMVCSLGVACRPEHLTQTRAATYGLQLQRWARQLEARL